MDLLRKSWCVDVGPTVMAGHAPASSRGRLSLRMAGTCPAMTVGQHAAGIFTLSWCPREVQAEAWGAEAMLSRIGNAEMSISFIRRITPSVVLW